jgi:hypothetical protein
MNFVLILVMFSLNALAQENNEQLHEYLIETLP